MPYQIAEIFIIILASCLILVFVLGVIIFVKEELKDIF